MEKYYEKMKLYKILKFGVTTMVLAIAYYKVKFIRTIVRIILNIQIIYDEFHNERWGHESSTFELCFEWFMTILMWGAIILVVGGLVLFLYEIIKSIIIFILDKLSIFEEIEDEHNAKVISKNTKEITTTTLIDGVPVSSIEYQYYIELKIGNENTITKEIEVDKEDWDELLVNANINVILSGYRVTRTKEVVDYSIELAL